MRNFINSRVVDGRQQITAAITFHTAGEQVLWPYGYTFADIPKDMTRDDHAALEAIGRKLAAKNGYHPMQSSGLYITDGDEIDWAYGRHRIFMYTLEMYPRGSTSLSRFYPPDEVISRETTRNKSAVLYLIDVAGCVYTPIGLKQARCGPFDDDLELSRGWQVNPLGTDTATSGKWQRADPAPTTYQSGTARSGRYALVTGASAGSAANANDVDGGRTSVRSPADLAPGHGRQADVPLLPRPRLERELRGHVPGVRRGVERHADAREVRGGRGQHRSGGLDVGVSIA